MSLTSGQQRKYLGGFGLGLVAFAVLLLAGCSSSPASRPQIIDRTHGGASVANHQVTRGQYRIQAGDTLYSIAFRFGWDWKDLAARNGIPAPYTIRPGQIIRFDLPPRSSAAVAVRQPAPPRSTVSRPAPVKSTPAPVPSKPKSTPAPTKVQSVQSSSQGWAWPTTGTLIGKFSSNGSLNKGVDIAGQLGQPVLAASAGTVVYAGSGLRGYGELVIIKHSDTYVSAYGHNRRLLVREGQQVKIGQHIAEMGSTGTDRVKLHFEIRRQGKPVDPLQYLPRR